MLEVVFMCIDTLFIVISDFAWSTHKKQANFFPLYVHPYLKSFISQRSKQKSHKVSHFEKKKKDRK